jgi:hypothetical protein
LVAVDDLGAGAREKAGFHLLHHAAMDLHVRDRQRPEQQRMQRATGIERSAPADRGSGACSRDVSFVPA